MSIKEIQERHDATKVLSDSENSLSPYEYTIHKDRGELLDVLKRANDMINNSYQCGWSDCADAIIRRFTAHRDRFLMPKNKHEQERLHSLNNLLDAIDRFRDTQTAITEYQEDKDAGFPHHTIIGSKP